MVCHGRLLAVSYLLRFNSLSSLHLSLNDSPSLSQPLWNTYTVRFSLITAAAGAPTTPDVSKVGRNFVTMSWMAPHSDGGAKILGYNVEARQNMTGSWVRAFVVEFYITFGVLRKVN